MGRPHLNPEYPKRTPGVPLLAQVHVAQLVPTYPPPIIDPNDFSSDRYGGRGATTRIEYFPGDPDPVNPEFLPRADALRADARNRSRIRGLRVEAPGWDTVSNERRAEVAGGVFRGVVYANPIPGP